MKTYLTEDEAIAQVRELVRNAGTQAALAKSIGMTEAHLSDVVRAKAGVSKALQTALGIRKVVMYERLDA